MFSVPPFREFLGSHLPGHHFSESKAAEVQETVM